MLLCVAMPECAVAQYHKERGLVREGNEQFDKRNYRSSYNRYNEALDHDSTSYEALYNRANAFYQYKTNTPEDESLDYKTSNVYYEQIAADTLLTDMQRAEIYRNLGESLFTQQQYEAALNSITVEDVKKVLQDILAQGNLVQVVSAPKN
jgi:tetratricopeptide (TPR) repeat protein